VKGKKLRKDKWKENRKREGEEVSGGADAQQSTWEGSELESEQSPMCSEGLPSHCSPHSHIWLPRDTKRGFW
jgi:hypothetical protein